MNEAEFWKALEEIVHKLPGPVWRIGYAMALRDRPGVERAVNEIDMLAHAAASTLRAFHEADLARRAR